MLKQRIITAVILAPLAVAAVIWLPGRAMAIVAGIVFVLAFDEWVRLCGWQHWLARGLAGVFLALIFCSLFVAQQHLAWLAPVVFALACLWWLLSLAWLAHASFAAEPTHGHAWLKFLAGLWVVAPAWLAVLWLDQHATWGVWLLLSLCIVWAADIGAYFAGSQLGKHKLAPRISPGKTWEGVGGAVVLSLLVALAAGLLLGIHGVSLVWLLVLATLAVAASIVGDLVESLMKRHAMIKDSGSLFPGHGGLLDRTDSVCAFLPVFALGLWLLELA